MTTEVRQCGAVARTASNAIPNQRHPVSSRPRTLVVASDAPLMRTEFEETVASVEQFALAAVCGRREVLNYCKRLRPDMVVLDGSVEPAVGWTDTVRRLRALNRGSRIIFLLGEAASTADVAELDAVISAEFGVLAILEALHVLMSGALVSVGPRSGAAREDEPEVDYVARERLSTLTSREREILMLVTHGLSNREVGIRLRISPDTVKEYVSRILGKLEVTSRIEAAVLAVRAEFEY
ncbi:two-component system nitrate/nitrite response regulator NarP [Nocardia pseudobrasiliensis]|uniref:Two-component system nitrate/nitrite response regulator NarP n=2 Tax=Nocardia pseudobrasiliensis TaxID=45979 RepID=A0A370HPF4_9NOCA|nr:two-component system nitrate/nitrite response regulator NarP [Nocardia pseudobrasiliensis]